VDKQFNKLLTKRSQESLTLHFCGVVRFAVQCLLIDKNIEERGHLAGLLLSLGVECELLEELPTLGNVEHNNASLVFVEASSSVVAQDIVKQFLHQQAGAAAPKIICYAEAPRIDDMAACILAGASDVLVKPFDRDLLRFKLEQAGFSVH